MRRHAPAPYEEQRQWRFCALRQRRLAILGLSQVLSAIGDNFYAITIVWMPVRLSGSGAGYVVAAQSIAGFIRFGFTEPKVPLPGEVDFPSTSELLVPPWSCP